MSKLNARALGLSFGILWAVGVIFMGLTAIVCSWADPFVNTLSLMYIGYGASIVGSIIGALWGFVDGFIGGYCIAWLYNKFTK